MKELAEALKAKAGLRMRQGVVSAVDGSTVSVLIGGSTVAVAGVHHLNSVAPQVGEVVWIASDGADLWILGTHGDPPAIDPSRLPDYATYFASAAPEGAPATPTNVLGTALLNGLLVRWDRTAYDPWLTWEIQLSDDDWVSGDTFTTATQPVVVPLPPGGPFYLRVRAINSVASDVSEWGYDFTKAHANPAVEVDWDEMPLITETMIDDLAVSTPKLAANAVTAKKIDVADVQAAVVTAAVVNALELNASAIKAGTIDAARLDVASILASEITAADITGGSIEGVSITGSVLRTADADEARVEIDSAEAQQVQMFTGDENEQLPGLLVSDVDALSGGFIALRSPQIGVGAPMSSLSLDKDSADITARKGADFVQLSVGSAAKTVKIFGLLEVTDLVKARVPSCSILRTSNATIGNNTDVNPSLTSSATVEWDTDSFFDSDSPDGITIPVAGVYLLDFELVWAAHATGYRDISIVVNGSRVARQRTASPGNVLCMQQVSCVRELAANDAVQMSCRQTSGGNLTMNATSYAPRLAATWLRQAT